MADKKLPPPASLPPVQSHHPRNTGANNPASKPVAAAGKVASLPAPIPSGVKLVGLAKVKLPRPPEK